MLVSHNNPIEKCELKFADDSGEWLVEGYGSVFGVNDSDNDIILPGAFKKTLSERTRPIPMYINHRQWEVPVGDWDDLEEDDKGLKVSGALYRDHKEAPGARAALMRKSLDGLSIGFTIPHGGSEEKEDGGRLIKEIDLVEVSVVFRPANEAARVSQVKSMIDDLDSLKDCEALLRESGAFSKKAAYEFVSKIRTIARGEPGSEVAEKANVLINLLDRYRIPGGLTGKGD